MSLFSTDFEGLSLIYENLK